MTSQLAIQAEDLCKSYGAVLAVDHIDFQVAPGEMVGFLGPNGAGKSTTMRILTTFLPASSGYARILGHDVMADSMEVRSRIGYLPESVPLYPEMRVEEYLAYRAKLKGVAREGRQRRLEYCLERCRIREVRRRLIGTLSKGYRQRVGLADAMIADPPVLILDEPTSGLDPLQIRETLNTIRDLAGSHTVLLSTHILPEVEATCDRVIIINQGRIRWDGKLSDLARQEPVLSVEVRGPTDEVRGLLQAEPGVKHVRRSEPVGDGVTAFELELDGHAEKPDALAAKIVGRGWGLRRLDLRRQKLEDLYMRVVLRASAPAATAAVNV